MLVDGLIAGTIDPSKRPKEIWESNPEFGRYSLPSFRSAFNRSKHKTGTFIRSRGKKKVMCHSCLPELMFTYCLTTTVDDLPLLLQTTSMRQKADDTEYDEGSDNEKENTTPGSNITPFLNKSRMLALVSTPVDTIFKITGWQHVNPDGESATNQATKTGRQKVCQQHNNQPVNAGVSPQVQKGTVGLNQHFSLRRVSLS
jgi:hypothetical protein